MTINNPYLQNVLAEYFNNSFEEFQGFMIDDDSTTVDTAEHQIGIIKDNLQSVKDGSNDVLHADKQEQALTYFKREAKSHPSALYFTCDIDETFGSYDTQCLKQDIASLKAEAEHDRQRSQSLGF